jgi:DinB family protein
LQARAEQVCRAGSWDEGHNALVKSERDDLVDLFDYAWQRFVDRMAGLTKAEWMWSPTPDDRISLHWRLAHLTEMLAEERNWTWLGVPAPSRPGSLRMSPEEAMQAAIDAYTAWRELLTHLDDDALAAPIGALAGEYGTATRRSFVLHVVDELVHHAAEAALLRDLYAAATPGA